MYIDSERILSAFYALLLTIIIIVFNIIIGLGVGIYSRKNITKCINKSEYYQKIYEDIKSTVENILAQDGFPANLLDDVITLDKVYISGIDYVENVLGSKTTNQYDGIRDEVVKKIGDYIREERINETDELSEKIQNISTAINDEFSGKIKLKVLEYLMEFKSQYYRTLVIMVPCMLIMILVICYLLVRMQRYKHRGVRYISYALFASSILTIFIALYLLLFEDYSNVAVNPDYYNRLISEYLQMNIKPMMYIGLLGIAAAFVTVKLVGVMKRRIIR